MHSRRKLLTSAPGFAFAGALSALDAAAGPTDPQLLAGGGRQAMSLDGAWEFRLDPDAIGEVHGWHLPDEHAGAWVTVTVPHTFQVTPGDENYRGVAWYRRRLPIPREWSGAVVRIEFEAVFHSATVWVNGRIAGRHLRKGYTAFVLDITSLLQFGAENVVAVQTDNSFSDSMLPRARSSDWALDGGIYRPVTLLLSSPLHIEHVAVEGIPQLADDSAEYAIVEVCATYRNASASAHQMAVGLRVLEDDTGFCVLERRDLAATVVQGGATESASWSAGKVLKPRLWHFDHPHLYTLELTLYVRGNAVDQLRTPFGIRSIEVRGAHLYLNGEKVRLMGVERMAGSNPETGMAETPEWIAHDHEDLKNLNCVLSRVHWQQDRRVLDYCDRHGILLQSEVPAWGAETFAGSGAETAPDILQNGLEQLQEMIARDRNHPSIFAWGLCNEIDGQNPLAFEFARRLLAEAKRLDPRRLCSYASNSLERTPSRDVSGLMDFIECNEYFESWNPGTLADLRHTLQEIHQAFPGKPVVVSEYGYCACVPERPEADGRRIAVLADHTSIFREFDFIAGLIFFCYNDYRTHVGDKGAAATRQRVHGVVDLYGNRKPSYEALRRESSPVESVSVAGHPGALLVTVKARATIPAHRMIGYRLRGVLFGLGNIPLELRTAELAELAPGEEATVRMTFSEQQPLRIALDVLRPTAFSAYTQVWRPST